MGKRSHSLTTLACFSLKAHWKSSKYELSERNVRICPLEKRTKNSWNPWGKFLLAAYWQNPTTEWKQPLVLLREGMEKGSFLYSTGWAFVPGKWDSLFWGTDKNAWFPSFPQILKSRSSENWWTAIHLACLHLFFLSSRTLIESVLILFFQDKHFYLLARKFSSVWPS